MKAKREATAFLLPAALAYLEWSFPSTAFLNSNSNCALISSGSAASFQGLRDSLLAYILSAPKLSKDSGMKFEKHLYVTALCYVVVKLHLVKLL